MTEWTTRQSGRVSLYRTPIRGGVVWLTANGEPKICLSPADLDDLRRLLIEDLAEECDRLRGETNPAVAWPTWTCEQRLAFLELLRCCRGCGDLDTRCQCQNDE